MRKLPKMVLCLLIWSMNTFAMADQQEFKEINERRTARKVLIDYLKQDGKAQETAAGTLKIAAGVDSTSAQAAIEDENADRVRQFTIIASIKGMSKDEVASQFAQKMGVDTAAPDYEVLLKLHGSNTVGASLAPSLVQKFLIERGYRDISIEKQGVESFIRFSQPGKKSLGLVEIKAHGSSTAFSGSGELDELGLAGKFCDLGMASRPAKDKEVALLSKNGIGNIRSAASEYPIALDGVAVIINRENPVSNLTVEQVAGLFSGKIANWKELGGPDQPVHIYARDEHSGTWDTFKSKVLKPSKLSLAEKNVKRYEDSGKLVLNVAGDPAGIGFIGLAYVDTSVKAVPVQAGEGARALEATRLTVKSEDYPLSRLLYFYMPTDASAFTRDFVKFTMSEAGQKVVDQVGLVGQGRSTKRDFSNADKLKKDLLEMADLPADYRALIEMADRRDTQSNLRYRSGSDQLDINSLNNLDRLAKLLADPDYDDVQVVLIGFADNVGAARSNQRISERRAQKVADMLAGKGVQGIQVAGFGEALPVADNASESGRAKNRRVEIWLQR